MPHPHREHLVALVPQKTLARTKTRLRSVLSREARTELSLQMLRHVLDVCRRSGVAEAVLLCGPVELQALADEFGAELLEGGEKGMRRDVSAAAAHPLIAGRAAMLFVSSDLPLLAPEDLEAVVAPWRAGLDLVLAPDRRERGTNAMLVNEPEVFPYAFGEAVGAGSFHTHRDQAIGHDMHLDVVRRPGLQLDVDLPEDIAELISRAPEDPVAQFCAARYHEQYRFE